ncbi:hypothetical protein [Pseudarthrobacter siccitolerans]|nr:hypothetical protein [Pseudarthrobacter siccitolerans]
MNLIIHRSLLRGHPPPAELRRLHGSGHRLVTDFRKELFRNQD